MEVEGKSNKCSKFIPCIKSHPFNKDFKYFPPYQHWLRNKEVNIIAAGFEIMILMSVLQEQESVCDLLVKSFNFKHIKQTQLKGAST